MSEPTSFYPNTPIAINAKEPTSSLGTANAPTADQPRLAKKWWGCGIEGKSFLIKFEYMNKQVIDDLRNKKLSIWDRYFLGEGVASRKEFWCTYVVLILMAFVVAHILLCAFEPHSQAMNISKMLYRIININVLASVTIRRLHDIGKSGWWYLLVYTVIGIIPILYWTSKKGLHDEILIKEQDN